MGSGQWVVGRAQSTAGELLGLRLSPARCTPPPPPPPGAGEEEASPLLLLHPGMPARHAGLPLSEESWLGKHCEVGVAASLCGC